MCIRDRSNRMNENAKTKLVLEYTGMDDFSCPVYKDQFGKLWKEDVYKRQIHKYFSSYPGKIKTPAEPLQRMPYAGLQNL